MSDWKRDQETILRFIKARGTVNTLEVILEFRGVFTQTDVRHHLSILRYRDIQYLNHGNWRAYD